MVGILRATGLVALSMCSVAACGSPAAPPPPPSVPVAIPSVTTVSSAAAPMPTHPARTAPLSLRYAPGPYFRALPDGRVAAISTNRRVLIRAGAVTVVDADAVDDLGRFAKIPDALGGGFLFVGKHTVRYAADFDTAIETIATLSPDAREVHVDFGWSRVMVSSEKDAPAAFSLPSGRSVPIDPPGCVEMFGAPEGYVAARTQSGDLYVSLSKGAPFRKAAASGVMMLRYDGRGIIVDSRASSLLLSRDGTLAPAGNGPGMTMSGNFDVFVMSQFPDLSNLPPPSDAENAISVFARSMDASTTVMVHGTDLWFLDPKSGKNTKTVTGAFAGQSSCFMIRGGTPSFAGCNAQAITIFRIDAPGAAPVREKTIPNAYTQDFDEPPSTAALALARKCDGTQKPGFACVRKSADHWVDVPPPPDPQGLLKKMASFEQIAATSAGIPYLFGWGDPGTLLIVDGAAKKVRSIALSATPGAKGIRWDALTIDNGALRFLLADGGLLEILPDDTFHVTEMPGAFSAIGPRALRSTPDGKLHETLDAGRSFHDVAPPPDGLPVERISCNEGGCEVGPWIRFGWGESL